MDTRLTYKPDIERVKKWHEAFWNRELLKRPLLIVNSHRDKVEPYRKRLVDPVTQWTDIDLYFCPDKIKEALNYIFEYVYKPVFTEIYKILTRFTDITSDLFGIVSNKKHDLLQADFLALISPKMAFVLSVISGVNERF